MPRLLFLWNRRPRNRSFQPARIVSLDICAQPMGHRVQRFRYRGFSTPYDAAAGLRGGGLFCRGLCSRGQSKRNFRGFLRPDNSSFGPIREDSIRIRAQVVLAGVPSRKFKMSVGVSVRRVRMHPVRGLNGHAGIRDRFAMPVEHCPFHRAQATGKLRMRGNARRQRHQTREYQNGESNQNSFHSAPRNGSRMQFYAQPTRAIGMNPWECYRNATPVRLYQRNHGTKDSRRTAKRPSFH